MYTKQVDAYNRQTRRCAVRSGSVFMCYVISERPGSEILKSAVPHGTVATLEDAKRWVDGESVMLMPPEGLPPGIDC